MRRKADNDEDALKLQHEAGLKKTMRKLCQMVLCEHNQMRVARAMQTGKRRWMTCMCGAIIKMNCVGASPNIFEIVLRPARNRRACCLGKSISRPLYAVHDHSTTWFWASDAALNVIEGEDLW